jgi:hypothetical protein
VAHDTRTPDSELRDHFVALYVDLRELFSRTLPDDRTESGESVWEIWSPIVDALLAGESVVVARYELPDWHPESPKRGGDPGDRFELGSDDILRPYEPLAHR